jgi:hypothetical protein
MTASENTLHQLHAENGKFIHFKMVGFRKRFAQAVNQRYF